MGKVIPFGVGAAQPEEGPPSAGAPEPELPTPEGLAADIQEGTDYLRHATTRLTNLVAPGAANEERLVGLFNTHVTIQDNIGDLNRRLQEAAGDDNLAQGAYVGIANDVREVQQQIQTYIEGVESLIGEQPQQTALAPARMRMGWPLWLALGVGAAGAVGFGVWMWRRKKS